MAGVIFVYLCVLAAIAGSATVAVELISKGHWLAGCIVFLAIMLNIRAKTGKNASA